MSKRETILVPDIGDFASIDVVEVMANVGDNVAIEDSLISLESDKASLDVPSPVSGLVVEVLISVNDKVSKDTPICVIELSSKATNVKPSSDNEQTKKTDAPTPTATPAELVDLVTPPSMHEKSAQQPDAIAKSVTSHATPSVRRFARELSVDLALVSPTGQKNRILKTDVESFIRDTMRERSSGVSLGAGIPKPPPIDFSKFGPVEKAALSRVQILSASHLSMSWLNAPQVTQFDKADITDLEAFRKKNNGGDFKLSILPFLVKACTAALMRFPEFNSSLGDNGDHLILKKYFNIGIAVDTPNGLMVPVVREADKKGLVEIAQELSILSSRAREGKSRLDDFQGGSFTISSLGGIGGTSFTPIVNVPEVAILGVSRAEMTPVYNGDKFTPRLMLPLSLTYDHRVCDGANAARFTQYLSKLLGDVRRMLL